MKKWAQYARENNISEAMEPYAYAIVRAAYEEGYEYGVEDGYTQCEAEYNETPKEAPK